MYIKESIPRSIASREHPRPPNIVSGLKIGDLYQKNTNIIPWGIAEGDRISLTIRPLFDPQLVDSHRLMTNSVLDANRTYAKNPVSTKIVALSWKF